MRSIVYNGMETERVNNTMVELRIDGYRHDPELQIIQADVKFTVCGDVLVDEPLCIDVGLPSLLNSVINDVNPNRWAPVEQWMMMPFFVCGCGDPECRAMSFVVHHNGDGTLQLQEIEERHGTLYRVLAQYDHVPLVQYRIQVMAVAQQFLDFIEGKDYRPLLPDTVPIVRQLLLQLHQMVLKPDTPAT